MDLATRKYNFIQELVKIEKESIIDALERVLKQEKGEDQVPLIHKKELDKRMEDYQNAPENLLDWKDVENTW